MAIYGYERLECNGKTLYTAQPFDPWLAQDQAFVAAVRQRDPTLLQSDYADGLRSLAPILAGWQSAQKQGVRVDVLALANHYESDSG